MNSFADSALAALQKWALLRQLKAPPGYSRHWEFAFDTYGALQERTESEAAALYALLFGLSRYPAAVDLFAPPDDAETLPRPPHLDEPLGFLPTGGIYGVGGKFVTLHVFGEVAFRSINPLIEAAKNAEEVSIIISSAGGNTIPALRLCHALAGKKVTTTCIRACSAASLIFQAGTTRRICSDGTLMVHSAVGFCGGSSADLRAEADHLDTIREKMAAVYLRTCKAENVAKWLASGDHYFSATEALAAGLADEIITLPEPTTNLAPAPPVTATQPPADPDAEAEALAVELLVRLQRTFKNPSRFQEIAKCYTK